MSVDGGRRKLLGGLLVGAALSSRTGRFALGTGADKADGDGGPARAGRVGGSGSESGIGAGRAQPSDEGRVAGSGSRGSTPHPGSAPASGQSSPAPSGPPPSNGSAPSRPVVYRARREKILPSGGKPDPALLAGALGAAVAGAGGERAPAAAMRRLFRPSDVVGIKVNCIAGKGLSPRPELVDRLVRWLQEAGVPARGILVWDRTDRELTGAGFKVSRAKGDVRICGTNDDWDWKPREWGPNASSFARVLVEELTALINVGVLKDHGLAGTSVGMKNWYGVIHNPNKCHDNGCSPYVAHLAAYPLIREKLRLTVIDALTAQCHGGPGRSPRWAWPYGGVLASTEPVAIDAVGTRIIEDRRREVGLDSLAKEERFPRWLAEAAKLGVGESDLGRIRVEDV